MPAVFAAQVVEHLDAQQLTELLSLVQRKLAPGGLAIFETVNGHNPAALKAFWTDTTHHHPLYPEVLLALARLAGFESGEVRFPQETGDFNADVYANRDYAVYARKAALELAHEPRRHAGDERLRSDVRADDGARGDDRVGADPARAEEDRAGADPGALLDDDVAAGVGDRLLALGAPLRRGRGCR